MFNYKLSNDNNMTTKIFGLFLMIMSMQSSYAQQPPTETIKTAINNTPEQHEIINLSKQKWQWMEGKNADSLDALLMTVACLFTWVEAGEKHRK
jgi:hypothetical protein